MRKLRLRLSKMSKVILLEPLLEARENSLQSLLFYMFIIYYYVKMQLRTHIQEQPSRNAYVCWALFRVLR